MVDSSSEQNRYKIAVITSSYPPKGGGIAAAHFNLAKCLQLEHDVRVFAFDDNERSQDVDIVRAKTPVWQAKILEWLARMWVMKYAPGESAVNCERIFRVIPAILSINRKLRAFKPDYIICPDNYVPALVLKKTNKSIFLWVAHNNFRRFEGNPVATDYSWIDLLLAHRLELRASRKADAFIAVSEYMLDVTLKTMEPVVPVRVIKNCIDTDYMSKIKPSKIRDKLGVNEDTIVVYIPSGGTNIKGERYTFEIIRRLERLGNIAFFISGSINNKLDFELNSLATDVKVYRPGLQCHSDNLRDVAACDLTISPTLIENYSSAIIESLSLGVPVVTFDVGGNKELITNNQNGFLVPYLDIEALLEKSQALIIDIDKLITMKQDAKLSVLNLSNTNKTILEYNSLFSELLQ